MHGTGHQRLRFVGCFQARRRVLRKGSVTTLFMVTVHLSAPGNHTGLVPGLVPLQVLGNARRLDVWGGRKLSGVGAGSNASSASSNEVRCA